VRVLRPSQAAIFQAEVFQIVTSCSVMVEINPVF